MGCLWRLASIVPLSAGSLGLVKIHKASHHTQSPLSLHASLTFFAGGAALDLNAVTPKPCKWILDMTWLNLVELSTIAGFTEIRNQVWFHFGLCYQHVAEHIMLLFNAVVIH